MIPFLTFINFDHYYELMFWLEMNNEANVFAYDRYEPRLGPKSCHKYFEL